MAVKQIRELEPGTAFVWRGKRYVLEPLPDPAYPEYHVASRGKTLESFLGGQVVELIVPELGGQLGMFGGDA